MLEVNKSYVYCSASTNNILAIATAGHYLGLWDVRTWEMFHSKHLTADLKYLTIGGNKGEKCIVMEIK